MKSGGGSGTVEGSGSNEIAKTESRSQNGNGGLRREGGMKEGCRMSGDDCGDSRNNGDDKKQNMKRWRGRNSGNDKKQQRAVIFKVKQLTDVTWRCDQQKRPNHGRQSWRHDGRQSSLFCCSLSPSCSSAPR